MSNSTTSSEQAKRFAEAARELGADESADALDRVIGKLDLKRKPEANTPPKQKGPAKGP